MVISIIMWVNVHDSSRSSEWQFSPNRPTELIWSSICVVHPYIHPSVNFFETSHWPSDHIIRSWPLIGQPSFRRYYNCSTTQNICWNLGDSWVTIMSKDLTPFLSPKYYKNHDILGANLCTFHLDPLIVQRFAPFLAQISVLAFLRLE